MKEKASEKNEYSSGLIAVNLLHEKVIFHIIRYSFFVVVDRSTAQCSICTKTTQQLGEKPAKSLNSGILYLAFAPLCDPLLTWVIDGGRTTTNRKE